MRILDNLEHNFKNSYVLVINISTMKIMATTAALNRIFNFSMIIVLILKHVISAKEH